jgi:hypothetical protein
MWWRRRESYPVVNQNLSVRLTLGHLSELFLIIPVNLHQTQWNWHKVVRVEYYFKVQKMARENTVAELLALQSRGLEFESLTDDRDWIFSVFTHTFRKSFTPSNTCTPQWNTCCHNAAYHITMYFHWSIPHYCSFSKAQHTLPENGPIGSKHVGANKEIF